MDKRTRMVVQNSVGDCFLEQSQKEVVIAEPYCRLLQHVHRSAEQGDVGEARGE